MPQPKIMVEVTITDLSPEQQARFGANVEWLNTNTGQFYEAANPAGVDITEIRAALRVTFVGEYDPEEDDFVGNTYFTRSLSEEDTPTSFSKKDKQHCGFLFLRSLRTRLDSRLRFGGHIYFNVFRHRKRADLDAEAYAADAALMEVLARAQKGFISYRRYTASDGEFLSLSEWETEDDARAWASNPEHAVTQARGRSRYYESYVLYSCAEPKVRRFKRSTPPLIDAS